MERHLYTDAAPTEDPIHDTIEPVVSGLGYSLVAVKSKTVKERLRVSIVIYSQEGVTLDDCAAVHQAVMPRIEVLQDNRDVYLEVSSPGIDRNLQSSREFAIFQGRGARVLRSDTDEWVAGIIVSADEKEVVLENESGRRTVAVELVRKAKLDESQEVR